MFVRDAGLRSLAVVVAFLLSLSGTVTGSVALASETGSLVGSDVGSVAAGDASVTGDSASGKKQVPKPYMPTMIKLVSVGGGELSDKADASVGTLLGYRLVGTLPERLDSFETYPYAFIDHPEDSVVVDVSSVRVARVHGSAETDVTSAFSVSVEDGAVSVSCPDVKAAILGLEATDSLVVTYSATLSGPGVGLADPNENKAHVTYTDTNGKREDTPDDVTFVYSCALELTKVEKGGTKSLSGAKFAIRETDGGWFDGKGFSGTESSRKVLVTDDKGRLEVSGIGAGSYELHEIEAPSGYELLSGPVSVVIVRGEDGAGRATLTATSRDAEVTSVSADTGLVSVKVEDPRTATSSGSDSGVRPASTSRAGSSIGGSGSSAGPLSKTGDATSYAVGLVVGGIGIAMVSFGVVRSRRCA